MNNAIFEALLTAVTLYGASKLYAIRARPGAMFGAAALLCVTAAASFGILRYGGVTAGAIVAANDNLAILATIVAPSWTIAALLPALRGGQGALSVAAWWLVPAAIVVLAFLPATTEIGEIYAQAIGLGMLLAMLMAAISLALRGDGAAGAALALGAVSYGVAAFAAMGAFGFEESAALDLFHAGICVWAAGLAFGLIRAAPASSLAE